MVIPKLLWHPKSRHHVQEFDNEVEQFEATLAAMDAVGGGSHIGKLHSWVWVRS